MSAKSAIVTNTSAQLIGKLVNTTSSLIVTVLLARSFGAGYYGDFTKAFVTATLLFTGIDFGINAIIVRRIGKEGADEQEEFRNALGLRLLLAATALGILLVFLGSIPTASDKGYSAVVKVATAIFGLTFFAHASFTTANAIFQRRLQYGKSAIASVAGSLVVLAAVVGAVRIKADVRVVAVAHLSGSVVMMAVALLFVRGAIGRVRPTFAWKKVKGLFREALPIGTMLLLNIAALRIGTILLSLFRQSSEVGFYGLAYRAFDVVLVFPTFFMNATYPIMVEREKQGQKELLKLVKKVGAALLASSLLFAFLLFWLSPLLAIIKEEFRIAQAPLKILSFSLPMFFLSSLMQWTLVTVKKEGRLARVYAAALSLSILANVVMIPRFGMLAPAANIALTETLVLLLTTSLVLQSLSQKQGKRKDAKG